MLNSPEGISKIGMMFIMTPQSWLVTAMVTMAQGAGHISYQQTISI